MGSSNPEIQSLGRRVAPLLADGFFRPFSRPSAAVYIDCADRLIQAADEGGQVPFHEARLLIREVLLRHPDIHLEEDEGGQFRDLNQRAGQFFNKLIEVHWFEPRRVNLDEHYVLVSPNIRRVMRLLHDLAENRPAELRDFAASLRSLCRDLLAEGALDPNRLGPVEMRQTMKDLLDRAGRAEDQMHSVETLILQHETAQRGSNSAQETLERFLVDFHAGEHMVCYDALQESGLIPRITAARSAVQEALYDPFTKQRLAEGLAAHLELDATAAYIEAEKWLGRLERLLASIPIKQRLIDGRMADFSRLSAARYRYQTEMRGRRPEQAKAYIQQAADLHAGASFADLANEPGMQMLAPHVSIYFGLDSLSRPRRQRAQVDLSVAIVPEQDQESAADEIRRRNLNILTPQRASRFVEKYLPQKGSRISTENLRLTVEDDLLDLLATLAFDRGPAIGSHRVVRWKVHTVRGEFCAEPESIPRDVEADRLMERFSVERIS